MLVDYRSLTAEVLIEGDAVVRQPQQPGQPTFAVLDRLAPDVLAVHLEEIERAQDGAHVGGVAADDVEHGEPIVVADDCLAVDDARSDGQGLDRRRGEREAVRQVVAVSSDQPNAEAAPMRQDAESIVLDFVQPTGPSPTAPRPGAADKAQSWGGIVRRSHGAEAHASQT